MSCAVVPNHQNPSQGMSRAVLSNLEPFTSMSVMRCHFESRLPNASMSYAVSNLEKESPACRMLFHSARFLDQEFFLDVACFFSPGLQVLAFDDDQGAHQTSTLCASGQIGDGGVRYEWKVVSCMSSS